MDATGGHVRVGYVSGESEAADAGEVDADWDREPLREFRGATKPRVDGVAILLQPRWGARLAALLVS